VEDYIRACNYLRADINISPADLTASDRNSVKRMEKSADRTHAWLRNTISAHGEQWESHSPLFASILPIEKEQQSFYLSDLADDFIPYLSGLCLYSPSTVTAIPESLEGLPRLCLANPTSPHEILSAVSVGIDLITTPFVTQISEQGMAFSFTFPPPRSSKPEPLAFDLWSTSHAMSLEPLTPDCVCYTCTRHHRAYIHHLLQAREMLAWTLLQIHNFAVLDTFFASIRESIANIRFEEDCESFNRTYETEMPTRTGQGPRVRGYQVKSVGGGESKKNPKSYGRLDDQLQKSAEFELAKAEN
jgi:queuine tRNA-ribosyltransferase accessory subunit